MTGKAQANQHSKLLRIPVIGTPEGVRHLGLSDNLKATLVCWLQSSLWWPPVWEVCFYDHYLTSVLLTGWTRRIMFLAKESLSACQRLRLKMMILFPHTGILLTLAHSSYRGRQGCICLSILAAISQLWIKRLQRLQCVTANTTWRSTNRDDKSIL